MQGTDFSSVSLFRENISRNSEHVSEAIQREFIEEAMNSNPDGEKHIKELFRTAVSVRNF